MLIFIGYPIVYNWIISLQDVTATTLASAARDFVGLDNFKAIFSDVTFRKSVLHTFVYTIGCLVIQFSLGFLLAMFFKKIHISKTNKRVYRYQLDASGYGYCTCV